MNLNEWRESGFFFDWNGHDIFYRLSRRSHEILLCLHGFPSSSFDYRKIYEPLAGRFAVLTCDLIGYGFSAKPTDFDYTTFRQVDLLEDLLAHLQIKKIHILAHDYGNTLTQEILARAEENRLKFTIQRIFLLNGALFPETHRPVLAQKILISPLGFLFARLISDKLFKKNLAKIFGAETQPTAAELDDFLAVFKAGGGRKIAHKLIRYMPERERYRARWVGALQRTRVPLRFVNGLEDKISGAHLVRRFRELMPHEDVIELPGVGHYPHFEVPDKVLRALFEFYEID